MTDTNLVYMDDFRNRNKDQQTSLGASQGPPRPGTAIRTFDATGGQPPSGYEPALASELYDQTLVPSVLSAALRLLEKARALTTAALEALPDDPILADERIGHLEGMTAELFCCRHLGNGFAAVVVAVGEALRNRAGQPLSVDQVRVLHAAIGRLEKEPFLSLETAVDVVMDIENKGLIVDPPEVAHLADLSE